MGVNPSNADPTLSPDDDLDLLAAYAAGAVDTDDALLVEARMAGDAAVTRAESVLRHAAAEYAALLVDDVDVPSAVRARTLAAAFARREGHPALAASAVDTFLVESERFATTLRRLTAAQWQLPVDPPEFAGWTVHDLAVHVTTTQSLFAQLVGAPDPLVPETDNSNDGRTAAAQARHRSLTPDAAVTEYERATALVASAVTGRSDHDLTDEIEWWGASMRISTVLLHRSFETWTHHDDVRRAVGLDQLPPPAPSLAAMSTRAAEWTGLFLASVEANAEGDIAVIDLTGPGGGTHVVDLGVDPPEAAAADEHRSPARARFTLRMDVVDYCRAIGNRVPAGGFAFEAAGDTELATTLVRALPALAGL